MTAEPTIRPVEEHEFAEWARTGETPFFGQELDEERLARLRSLTELPRTLAAFEGSRMVATSALCTMNLSVPGGSVPMAGLTAVGVLPTHRRRGLLTRLMRQHLDDVVDEVEPISGLYAAEGPIYGRYGYGPAAASRHLRIEQSRTAFDARIPLARGVRLVTVEEALAEFPGIYDAVRANRPGMPDRSEARWRAFVGHDLPEWREGQSRRYLAQLDGRGYVMYRGDASYDHNLPRGTLSVVEHMAVDAEAAATLWRFVFDHDLITTIRLDHRPTDDLLQVLLADPRRLTGWETDSLWLRVVRVGEALTARRYDVEESLVLDVADDLIPDNQGSWLLETGADGARCTPTSSAPDLSIGVADLGAAYLGHRRLSQLLRAGLITEHRRGAAARADRLLFTEPAAWCPQEF